MTTTDEKTTEVTNSIEDAAAALHAKHGGACVGLFYAGDMKKCFSSHFAAPPTKNSILAMFAEAGRHLAIEWERHTSEPDED